MSEVMPTLLNALRSLGSVYSKLSTLATVRLAPRALASMQAFILRFSSGVTAMKRSAPFTPASFRVRSLDAEACIVMRS